MIWLPGVDIEIARDALAARFGPPTELSLGAIGITPFLAAAIVVECVARIVPRWRSLRRDDLGRATLLRATAVVTAIFAAMQSLMLVSWLRSIISNGETIVDLNVSPGLIATSTMVGCFVCVGGAAVISRYGVGNGISWVVGLAVVGEVAPAIVEHAQAGWSHASALATVAVVVASVGLSLLVGRGTSDGAPQPAGGLLGVHTAAAPLTIPVVAEVVERGSLLETVLSLCLTAATTAAFVWLMYRPAVLQRAKGRAAGGLRATHGRDQSTAIAFAVAVVVVDAIGRHFYAAASVVGVVLVATIARDIFTELLFRWQHGAVSRLAHVHDLARLETLLQQLAERRVDVCAAGQCHRLLGHFFMPYVPVSILVPAEQLQSVPPDLFAPSQPSH